MQKAYNNIKEKLDGLDVLPSNVQFDAAKAWQKMEQELQQPKQKKKRFVWLSWAAILLIMLSIGLLWNSNRNEEIAVKPILKSNLPKVNVQQEKNNIIVFDNNEITKQSCKVVDDKYKEEKKLISQQPVAPITITVIDHDTISTVNNSVILEDTIATTATTKPKTKLRIVHINELNEQPAPTMADNTNRVEHLLKHEEQFKPKDWMLRYLWLKRNNSKNN